METPPDRMPAMFGALFKKLRDHVSSEVAYHVARSLVIGLEAITGVALIWYFFLRDALPLSPMGWLIPGCAYTLLSVIYIIMIFPGRFLFFKVQAYFYFSVAIFFPLKGWMFLHSRDFSPLGFYALWVIILFVSMRETLLAMRRDFGEP